MNLRNKTRAPFSGFTTGEVEKMEHLLKENDGQAFDPEFCKKLARAFNISKARAGKPMVKWNEVENWFQTQGADGAVEGAEERAAETAELFRAVREACSLNGRKGYHRKAKGKNVPKLPKMEFEAKSLKDNAWYDVEKFVGNRHLNSPDTNLGVVLVRFSGFKKDQDEWVKVKNAVRQRSIPLEDSECHMVKVGETALYYQEKKTEARFFEVIVSDISRKVHDVRGCRCTFTVRYLGGNIKEKAQLKSLCFRPSILES